MKKTCARASQACKCNAWNNSARGRWDSGGTKDGQIHDVHTTTNAYHCKGLQSRYQRRRVMRLDLAGRWDHIVDINEAHFAICILWRARRGKDAENPAPFPFYQSIGRRKFSLTTHFRIHCRLAGKDPAETLLYPLPR